MMHFIPPVKLIDETDDIFIPFMEDFSRPSPLPYLQHYCHFKWLEDDSDKDFIEKNTAEHHCSFVDRKHFYSKSYTEKQQREEVFSDLDIHVYRLKPINGDVVFLISLFQIDDWESLRDSFCIPPHQFNLNIIYSHIRTVYPFMSG